MNKKREPFDIDKEILRHKTWWHRRVALVDELLKESDDLAKVHPSLGLASLYNLIKDSRRFCRSYLRSRFGYKTGGKDFYSTERGGFLKPERKPSDEDWLLFVLWIAEWAAFEGAFMMLMPELKK